eukprot:6569568-Prymnesium_polylepis.1
MNTDGAGHFKDEAAARGVATLGDSGGPSVRTAGTGIAIGDYDGDGFLDLYVGEWRPYVAGAGELSGSRLLRNQGSAAPCHFEDATEAAGVALEARAPSLLRRASKPYPYPCLLYTSDAADDM